jgi:hypothetical protein
VQHYIEHRQDREAAILRRLAKGEADIPTLVRAIYIGLDPRLVNAAGLSVLAHLALKRQSLDAGVTRYAPCGACSASKARKAGGESRNPYTGDTFLPWEPSMLRDKGAPGTPPHLTPDGVLVRGNERRFVFVRVIDPCVICRQRRVGVGYGKNVGCADDPVSRRSCSASRPMPHCMSASDAGAAG